MNIRNLLATAALVTVVAVPGLAEAQAHYHHRAMVHHRIYRHRRAVMRHRIARHRMMHHHY